MTNRDRLTDRQFDEIIKLVMADAEKKEKDAGYRGEWHDGGAGKMRAEVEAFVCGLARELPPSWKKYEAQYEREADFEWKEYQRLQEKFKDRGDAKCR